MALRWVFFLNIIFGVSMLLWKHKRNSSNENTLAFTDAYHSSRLGNVNRETQQIYKDNMKTDHSNCSVLRKKRSTFLKDVKPQQQTTPEDSSKVISQKYYRGIGCFCQVVCDGCCNSLNLTDSRNNTWNNCLKKSLKRQAPAKEHTTSSWACVSDIWMVTSCHDKWPYDAIRNKCLAGMNFSSNKITPKANKYQVPVYVSNGVVFRNRFCAQCNYYQIFQSFHVRFTCNSTPPSGSAYMELRDFLLMKCLSPAWFPQGDHLLNKCPKLALSCPSQSSFQRKKRAFTKHQSCDYCAGIEKMSCENEQIPGNPGKTLKGTVQVSNAKTKNIPSLSLSVPFEFLEKPAVRVSVNISCAEDDLVYDPYLERCRLGITQKPKRSLVDTYRINVFYSKNNTNASLSQFKEFFSKNLDGIRYFNDHFFSRGLQFDMSVLKIPLHSGKPYNSTQSQLGRLLQFNGTNIELYKKKIFVYKLTYFVLTCANLQEYHKNEYVLHEGFLPEVFINESRETFPYHNYFILENKTMILCRLYINMKPCDDVYVPFNQSEYTMLKNSTVHVQTIGKTFKRDEYDVIQGQVWVCLEFKNEFQRSYIHHNKSFVLSILTIVCMSFSIIGLVFVLVTYSLFSELRTPPGINLMNLSVAILLSQLMWIFASWQTGNPTGCTVIAVFLHYLFLVSFVWTSIIAFDTWRAFTRKGRRPATDSRREKLLHSLKYMAVGWGSVMILVIVCLIVDQLGIYNIQYGSSTQCWVGNRLANLYITVIPVGLLLTTNAIFFAMTVKAIKNTHQLTKLIKAKTSESERRQNLGVYIRIAAMMGFTWVFGFIAPFGWDFLWYPHVILNSSQGIYIAIAFGFTKRVRVRYGALLKEKRSRASASLSSTKFSLIGSSRRKASSSSHERKRGEEKE